MKTRSTSDDTFSSPPPSLPMATMIIACGVPVSAPIGLPWIAANASKCRATADLSAISASRVISVTTSWSGARPVRSRASVWMKSWRRTCRKRAARAPSSSAATAASMASRASCQANGAVTVSLSHAASDASAARACAAKRL